MAALSHGCKPRIRQQGSRTRTVRKFWSRLRSCQSKWPVQGYFILKNAIHKEMPSRVAGQYKPSRRQFSPAAGYFWQPAKPSPALWDRQRPLRPLSSIPWLSGWSVFKRQHIYHIGKLKTMILQPYVVLRIPLKTALKWKSPIFSPGKIHDKTLRGDMGFENACFLFTEEEVRFPYNPIHLLCIHFSTRYLY